MDLVRAVADLLALLEFLDDVGMAGCCGECREPVEPRHDSILDLPCRNMAGPAHHGRRAEAAFHHCPLACGERSLAPILSRPDRFLRRRRVVAMARIFHRIEVIEIAKEFVKTMDCGKKLVVVSQMVLAKLTCGVAHRLEYRCNGRRLCR